MPRKFIRDMEAEKFQIINVFHDSVMNNERLLLMFNLAEINNRLFTSTDVRENNIFIAPVEVLVYLGMIFTFLKWGLQSQRYD